MSAIFKRELRSYFTSPLGYIYLAIFFLFEGYAFTYLYSYGSPSVEVIFPTLSTVIVFVTPVITMRLLSEDRRQKVDQALLTAPVTVSGIILGKFFAALAVYGIAISPTILYQIIVTMLASPNWLVFLNGLAGAVLVGAALISIGMFISSLTESPIISCILTLVAFLALLMMPNMLSLIPTEVSIDWAPLSWLGTAISSALSFIVNSADKIGFVNLLSDFAGSVFHVVDVIYLLSVTAVFVFVSVRMVERRRWA